MRGSSPRKGSSRLRILRYSDVVAKPEPDSSDPARASLARGSEQVLQIGLHGDTGRLHRALDVEGKVPVEIIAIDRKGPKVFIAVTVDSYDPTGNFLFHQQGTVHATRITMNTDLKDLF